MAVIGTMKLLVMVKDAMFPLPELANPINGLLLVHSNKVPAIVGSEKTMFPVGWFLHRVNPDTGATVGMG